MIAHTVAKLRSRSGLLRQVFFLCLELTALAGLFVTSSEPHFIGDRLPLFWAAFGLGCCLAMALACKLISSNLLGRAEDYYERAGRGPDTGEPPVDTAS